MKPTPETEVQSIVNRLNGMETYMDAIDVAVDMMERLKQELNDALNKVAQYEMDTGLDAACKTLMHERDQLRKVADELAKQLENHVSICGGREHHKDNCEAPEYPCHDCELNDAIDIALKNHNQLQHVKERNEK